MNQEILKPLLSLIADSEEHQEERQLRQLVLCNKLDVINEEMRKLNREIGFVADFYDTAQVKCLVGFSNRRGKWVYHRVNSFEVPGVVYGSMASASALCSMLNRGDIDGISMIE